MSKAVKIVIVMTLIIFLTGCSLFAGNVNINIERVHDGFEGTPREAEEIVQEISEKLIDLFLE